MNLLESFCQEIETGIITIYKTYCRESTIKNKIDLCKCKQGDILLTSHGSILEYVSTTPYKHLTYLDHVVRYLYTIDGKPYPIDTYGSRTKDGFVYLLNRKPEYDHDIIAIIYN